MPTAAAEPSAGPTRPPLKNERPQARGGPGKHRGVRVPGATVVAARAGEMIHEPALAIRTGMFTGRLAQTVHAYPTWSLAIQQAAAQLFGQFGGRTARNARL